MTTTGFIYDSADGRGLARVTDNGEVVDATTNGQQVETIDRNTGNVFSLQGKLLGHLLEIRGWASRLLSH
jgi:hypothetical protein